MPNKYKLFLYLKYYKEDFLIFQFTNYQFFLILQTKIKENLNLNFIIKRTKSIINIKIQKYTV